MDNLCQNKATLSNTGIRKTHINDRGPTPARTTGVRCRRHTFKLEQGGRGLGVTHGAVSRQIKQLELYLGVPLLYRRPNGVEKTDAGERLHMATRQAFSALQIGVRDVRRFRDGRSVTISLSASLAMKSPAAPWWSQATEIVIFS